MTLKIKDTVVVWLKGEEREKLKQSNMEDSGTF